MNDSIEMPFEYSGAGSAPADTWPVMEQFYTLQGEGRYCGQAAYFIRLAGCHVRCSWCDVKAGWTARPEQYRPIEAILAPIPRQARIAVVTGGEPLLYDLSLLTDRLHEKGLRTHLETSGSRPLSGRWDWVCVSPKTAAEPLDQVLACADELKVVVCRDEDFTRAQRYARLAKPDCVLSLQPEWSARAQILPRITQYVQQDPRWRLSVQVHKYIDIP